MKNLRFTILGLSILGILSTGCLRNSLDIEVVEDGCRWLGIKNAKYRLKEDPCDSGVFSVQSDCTHNEDTSCIQYLKVNPIFYNEFNEEIALADVNKIYQGKEFDLTETTISFDYKYIVTDQSTAQNKVNYVVLSYLIESQSQDQSNSLSLRIHFPCTVINEDDYTVIKQDSVVKIDTTQETFPIDFWDHAAEDGDLIAAYLNGHTITTQLELFNPKKRFDIPKSWLKLGANDFVVFALNEGSSGPNTVSMAINNQEVNLGTFAKGLKTGNAVRIDL